MQQQQQHFQGGQLRPLPSAGFNSGQSVGATLPGSLSGMYPSSRSGSDMSNLSGLGAVGAANPLLMNGGLRLGMEGSGTYDAQNFPNLASASGKLLSLHIYLYLCTLTLIPRLTLFNTFCRLSGTSWVAKRVGGTKFEIRSEWKYTSFVRHIE